MRKVQTAIRLKGRARYGMLTLPNVFTKAEHKKVLELEYFFVKEDVFFFLAYNMVPCDGTDDYKNPHFRVHLHVVNGWI